MSKLKEIMVQYATQRGGGLPLTPEEMCNALVLWVESVFDNLSIEGGYLVQVQKEGTQFTININTKQLDTDIKANYFNANDLSELFEGSETVVVDVNEQDQKIEIHLDSEVVKQLGRAILKPLNAPTEDSVPIVTETNDVDYVPLSQIGGGMKLYLHKLFFPTPSESLYIISTKSEPFTNPAMLYARFNSYNTDIIRFWADSQTALTGGNVLDVAKIDVGEYQCVFKNSGVTLGVGPFDTFTDTVTPL